MRQGLTSDQPSTNEEQERIVQIEEADMETLKANFKQIMAGIVTTYGDDEEVFIPSSSRICLP